MCGCAKSESTVSVQERSWVFCWVRWDWRWFWVTGTMIILIIGTVIIILTIMILIIVAFIILIIRTGTMMPLVTDTAITIFTIVNMNINWTGEWGNWGATVGLHQVKLSSSSSFYIVIIIIIIIIIVIIIVKEESEWSLVIASFSMRIPRPRLHRCRPPHHRIIIVIIRINHQYEPLLL